MRERVFLDVDPATLLLPTSRMDRADPIKLTRQISRFGASNQGMPDIYVYRDRAGLLMIWEGVTRATRIAMLAPGSTVRVEVLETKDGDLSRLPKVEERLLWRPRRD